MNANEPKFEPPEEERTDGCSEPTMTRMIPSTLKTVVCAGAMIISTVTAPYLMADEEAMVTPILRLNMDVALRAANTVIAKCRELGLNVAVTVVDRGGNEQVMLRDTLAMDLTVLVSQRKAYTAMSFNTPTSELEDRFSAPFSVGKVERLILSGGGVPIEAGGTIIGGIGVSGAPSGELDETCARAGLDDILDDLEMSL